jgi:hypothetical protein
MGTNTSGAALIADGTNFNPVVISGDISINTSGVAAIGSGVIATADIADDAVSLAKMASGTDGNVISYDTSGNPVAVATGTDGQVLTSSGAGAVCAFEDAAGGGNYVLVSTVEASNSATIDITFTPSDADTFVVRLEGIKNATDLQPLTIRLSTDGGSSFASANYQWQNIVAVGGVVNVQRSTSDAEMQLQSGDPVYPGNDATSSINGLVTIHNPSDTALYTMCTWGTGWMASAQEQDLGSGAGHLMSAADVDAVQFLFLSGNITSGRFTLYKITHA